MEIIISSTCDFNSPDANFICSGHQACDGDSCSSEDCLVGA